MNLSYFGCLLQSLRTTKQSAPEYKASIIVLITFLCILQNAGRKGKKDVNYFRKHYIPWLDKVKMAEQEHPWDKYRPEKYQGPKDSERNE